MKKGHTGHNIYIYPPYSSHLTAPVLFSKTSSDRSFFFLYMRSVYNMKNVYLFELYLHRNA